MTLCLLILSTTISAETKLYSLQIPKNRPANFRLELPVENAGRLTIRAEWSIDRRLALRITPPSMMLGAQKRTGSSPLSMEIEIEPYQLDAGPWTLMIHADTAREGGEALLTVEFPEARAAEDPQQPSEQSPPPAPDPWMVPRNAPADIPTAWRRFFESTERFRALLNAADEKSPVDSCRWQDDFMRYLADRRDRLVDNRTYPAESTRTLLLDIADAVGSVEEIRTSREAIVAGPPPDDPLLRLNWLAFRKERFQLLEQQLDEVLQSLRRERAPALVEESWPVRLVSCLTACERYFEERIRLGEKRATSKEIAAAQWERLLAAADALRHLATVAPIER
jgi:hypothetical protein